MAIVFDRVNKVIEVESPAVEVTIQALLNAIRDFEDDQGNMDVAQVANAAGKDDLGAGVAVAITLELLNNWQLMFEPRPPPTWVQCIVKDGNLVGGIAGNPIKTSAYVQVKLIQSAYGTLTGGAGVWTEAEKDDLITTAEDTKNKVANLPADPASTSELDAAHGSGSWEGAGATPSEVWAHTDRRLSSRDIESPLPGEHLPSEDQVVEVQSLLDTMKGLGFESENDALRVIRQLVQAAGRRGAAFKV